MRFAYLGFAVAFNVAAYIVFKVISPRPHNLSWAMLFAVGLALGAINVFFFTAALREVKLAVAYPAFAGVSIAAIVAASAWLFGEKFTPINAAGAALVVAGIVALSK